MKLWASSCPLTQQMRGWTKASPMTGQPVAFQFREGRRVVKGRSRFSCQGQRPGTDEFCMTSPLPFPVSMAATSAPGPGPSHSPAPLLLLGQGSLVGSDED